MYNFLGKVKCWEGKLNKCSSNSSVVLDHARIDQNLLLHMCWIKCNNKHYCSSSFAFSNLAHLKIDIQTGPYSTCDLIVISGSRRFTLQERRCFNGNKKGRGTLVESERQQWKRGNDSQTICAIGVYQLVLTTFGLDLIQYFDRCLFNDMILSLFHFLMQKYCLGWNFWAFRKTRFFIKYCLLLINSMTYFLWYHIIRSLWVFTA